MTKCEIYVDYHYKGFCYLPNIPRKGEQIMFNGNCDDFITVEKILWCMNDGGTGAVVNIYGAK